MALLYNGGGNVHHIGLIRPFRAHHYLIGGDWGKENQLHAHDYRVEWILEGTELDQHGYLLDLVVVEDLLDAVIGAVKDKTLNDLAAFHQLNPSVERLARLLSDQLISSRDHWDARHRLARSVVKVWENEVAWASWSEELLGPGAWL